jgi:Holliday junction resolvase RusA-like endonuclease
VNQVTFSVDGIVPVPWGTNEWEWRAAIVRAARGKFSGIINLPPQVQLSVTLDFRLPAIQAARADLDNLAKPVLDTLFSIRNAQVKDPSLTGALFNVDDERVFHLTLSKTEVPVQAASGVSISVIW